MSVVIVGEKVTAVPANPKYVIAPILKVPEKPVKSVVVLLKAVVVSTISVPPVTLNFVAPLLAEGKEARINLVPTDPE